MGENSAIEWTDHTFNGWVGCAKVSQACTSCYAESWAKRTGQAGLWRGERRRTTDENWRKPVKWNKAAKARFEATGERTKVFAFSLADVFEDHAALPEWRAEFFDLANDVETPYLTWLLLTKRPENVMGMVPRSWHLRVSSADQLHLPGPLVTGGLGWPRNVWVGTTVEDQQRADERIPHLLRVPAPVRFLSCEPLLGPVDLRGHLMSGDLPAHCAACGEGHGFMRCPNYGGVSRERTDPTTREVVCSQFVKSTGPRHGIHWVNTGGESGPRARPSHPDWFRQVRDVCNETGVPFLFKQWGEWVPRGPKSVSPNYVTVDGVPRVRLSICGCNSSSDQTGPGGVPGAYRRHDCDLSQDSWMNRVGKAAAGRLLDGVQHDEVPDVR